MLIHCRTNAPVTRLTYDWVMNM